MILATYFRGQLLRHFGGVLLVLSLISFTNKFVGLMSKAAIGELSSSMLASLLLYTVPELITFLAPLAFFLAVVLTIGKSCSEQEFTIYQACGWGWQPIIRLCWRWSAMVMLCVAISTLWLLPTLAYKREALLSYDEARWLMQTLAPGRFYSVHNGALVFYVADVSDQRQKLHQVFIAEQPHEDNETQEMWTVLAAQEGRLITEEGRHYLALGEGKRYEGRPGRNDYSQVSYQSYGRLLDQGPKEVPVFNRTTPTSTLWSSNNVNFQAELQWRVSLPLTVPILALLALGIGVIPPRSGRYTRLLPALLLYIAYYNVLSLSRRWVEARVLPPEIGIWPVHATVVLLAMGVLAWRTGWWRRARA